MREFKFGMPKEYYLPEDVVDFYKYVDREYPPEGYFTEDIFRKGMLLVREEQAIKTKKLLNKVIKKINKTEKEQIKFETQYYARKNQ